MSPARRLVLRAAIIAAILGAVVAAAALAGRGGHHPATAPAIATIAPAAAADAGAPVGPAGGELLARVRSCSEAQLTAIAERMRPEEALGLYRQLGHDDLRAVCSTLPPALLAAQANRLLGIPEATIRHAARPGQLAAGVIDAAMGVAPAPADASRRELAFATAVDELHVPQAARSAFRPDERRIYACLDAGLEPDGEPGVLVRWSEEGSGTLVQVGYQRFDVNRRWNHVWFEPQGMWVPGTYRVRFYRIAGSVALIAEGSYIIRAQD